MENPTITNQTINGKSKYSLKTKILGGIGAVAVLVSLSGIGYAVYVKQETEKLLNSANAVSYEDLNNDGVQDILWKGIDYHDGFIPQIPLLVDKISYGVELFDSKGNKATLYLSKEQFNSYQTEGMSYLEWLLN